jgi:short subunit dehydrogenase-like uncharacterized protein
VVSRYMRDAVDSPVKICCVGFDSVANNHDVAIGSFVENGKRANGGDAIDVVLAHQRKHR